MVVDAPLGRARSGSRGRLGVDGISLFLVLLSALLFAAGARRRRRASERRRPSPSGCCSSRRPASAASCRSTCCCSSCSSRRPSSRSYFLIGGWGHERRGYAATKFFIYTFVGSALLLVGIVALVFIHESQTGVTTFDVRALATTHLSATAGVLLFLAFTVAFVVKAPIFPFHTWSPDAYSEAPARRLDPARRDHGQARHLRDRPLRPRALPARRRRPRAAAAHARRRRDHLRRRSSPPSSAT